MPKKFDKAAYPYAIIETSSFEVVGMFPIKGEVMNMIDGRAIHYLSKMFPQKIFVPIDFKEVPNIVGKTYDLRNRRFIEKQPFPSWTLNQDGVWVPPVPLPDTTNLYAWNESTKTWEIYV